MTHPQMHNLTTLIKRLEAATSRLEDLATVSSDPSLGSNITPGSSSSVTVASAAVPPPAPPVPQPPAEPLPPSIEAFDELINTHVAKYVVLSNEIGDLIAEQAKAVEKCFAAQRKFLVITTKAKKPDASSVLFMELLTGMQRQMTIVSNLHESNRASPLKKHLIIISEGIPGLAWVTVEAKPSSCVASMLEAAEFHGNRVIKEYKEKDPKHVEWVRSWYNVLSSLEQYVKRYHQMGVTWNAKGVDAQELLADESSSSTTSTAGVPPPPPPPPLPIFDGTSFAPPQSDVGAVFAEINQGAAVTSRLKKVDKSQMTHKNPALRGSSVVPGRPSSSGSLRAKSPAPPSKTKPAHLKEKKPPKLELDGSKWYIENYENETCLTLPDVAIHHSIFIHRCKNTTIKVEGKVNAISLSECSKTNLLAESLVSSIDIIKCTNFAVQVVQKIPTILIDQCDGGTLYLPPESLDCEIFTSKSTAINVNVPGAGDDGDYAERPVPEQMKHVIKDGQLVSEIVEHAG